MNSSKTGRSLEIGTQFLAIFVNSRGSALQRLRSLVISAAEASELGLDQLLHHHTHLGYLRFVNGTYFQQPIWEHKDLLTNPTILSSVLPINPPRICEECVKEDIEFHGISYWRRAHQLPGVDHCTKHEIPLLTTETNSLKSSQPRDAKISGFAMQRIEFKEYIESSSIQKFVVLSDSALLATVPLSPKVITSVLTSRATEVLGKNRGLLRKRVVDCFPEEWLRRHFPSIYIKSESAETMPLDEVLRSSPIAYVTRTYLLVMSLLWDHPEQAINACHQEAKLRINGINQSGGRRALQEVMSGKTITWACREHGVHLADFEFAFQNLLKELKTTIGEHPEMRSRLSNFL